MSGEQKFHGFAAVMKISGGGFLLMRYIVEAVCDRLKLRAQNATLIERRYSLFRGFVLEGVADVGVVGVGKIRALHEQDVGAFSNRIEPCLGAEQSAVAE